MSLWDSFTSTLNANTPSADDIGAGFAAGLTNIFKVGVTGAVNDNYGMPSGDSHQVVETRSSAAPVTVAGQPAPVQSAGWSGGAVGQLLTGGNSTLLLVGLGIGVVLFALAKVK
jgi:hypothetical protein